MQIRLGFCMASAWRANWTCSIGLAENGQPGSPKKWSVLVAMERRLLFFHRNQSDKKPTRTKATMRMTSLRGGRRVSESSVRAIHRDLLDQRLGAQKRTPLIGGSVSPHYIPGIMSFAVQPILDIPCNSLLKTTIPGGIV